MNYIDDTLDDAVKKAVAHGITVTVAAGNENEDARTTSPGNVPEVLTVGASDDDDRRWDNGHRGASAHSECVDLFAPGAYLIGAGADGDDATGGGAGTSAAASMVASAAALDLGAHPKATPAEVADHLIETSTKDRLRNIC